MCFQARRIYLFVSRLLPKERSRDVNPIAGVIQSRDISRLNIGESRRKMERRGNIFRVPLSTGNHLLANVAPSVSSPSRIAVHISLGK